MKSISLVLTFIIFCLSSYSQVTVTANFIAPDTVCVDSSVNIQNISWGATSYFWNFCTANINQSPTGSNLSNVGGLLSAPVYMDYVFTNGSYYGFVTNNHPGSLLRLDFGNSLLNTPVVTSLGNLSGAITDNAEGVQIANDKGNWYVLVAGGDVANGSIPSLTTISLGTNIANNTPTATNWGNIGNLSYPHDLYVFNDSNHWYGLTVNYLNSTITLFDLTASLSNTPTAINLGNIGNLSGPTGIQAINDNGNWRVFVTNATSSTLTRLDFGSSLLNIPTGVNLGNPGGNFVTCWDIYILKYCGKNQGFVINANGSYDIIKLDFSNSLLNIPTALSLGNQGNLNFPHSISKLFRVGGDVFSFVTNVNNNTISLLEFKGCTNSSIPNSTAQNPPPITYNIPGNFNINLTIDDGLPTQTSYCKQVVVTPCSKGLPVTITKFITNVTQKKINLNWNVENEDGIIDYTIQRSLTGHSDFVSIGTVIAKKFNSYYFIDNTAIDNQTYYYRLLLRENTNTINYSEIKTARITSHNKIMVIYPNPSKGNITVRLNDYKGTVKLTILSSIGQVILNEKDIVNENTWLTLKLINQSKGFYWLKAETSNEQFVEKIVLY